MASFSCFTPHEYSRELISNLVSFTVYIYTPIPFSINSVSVYLIAIHCVPFCSGKRPEMVVLCGVLELPNKVRSSRKSESTELHAAYFRTTKTLVVASAYEQSLSMRSYISSVIYCRGSTIPWLPYHAPWPNQETWQCCAGLRILCQRESPRCTDPSGVQNECSASQVVGV